MEKYNRAQDLRLSSEASPELNTRKPSIMPELRNDPDFRTLVIGN